MSAYFSRTVSDPAGNLAPATKVVVLGLGTGEVPHTYSDPECTSTYANPRVSTAGLVDFYTPDPIRLRLVLTLTDGTVYDEIVDTWPQESVLSAPAPLFIAAPVADGWLVATDEQNTRWVPNFPGDYVAPALMTYPGPMTFPGPATFPRTSSDVPPPSTTVYPSASKFPGPTTYPGAASGGQTT